jgi:hypothetical protein
MIFMLFYTLAIQFGMQRDILCRNLGYKSYDLVATAL